MSWKQPPYVTIRLFISVILMIFLVAGTISNVLCFFTMLCLRNIRFSTRFLFCSMALCDIIHFPFNMLYVWSIFAFNIIPEDRFEFVCRIFRFFSYTLTITGWWVLMIISIERFLMVFAPQRMRIDFPKKVAPICVFTVLIIWMFISSVYFDFHIIGCKCVFAGSQRRYFVFAIMLVISYVVIIGHAILSSFVLYRVLSRRARRVVGQNQVDSERLHLTPFKISTGVGVVQLFCMLPFFVIYIEGITGKLAHLEGGFLGIISWSAYALFMSNFGSNFFVCYFMSNAFRRTFKNIFLSFECSIHLGFRKSSEDAGLHASTNQS